MKKYVGRVFLETTLTSIFGKILREKDAKFCIPYEVVRIAQSLCFKGDKQGKEREGG